MKYIPQSAPFEMIDELVSTNEGVSVTRLLIVASNVLVENNQFLEAGLLENMAQTAAAGTGYLAAQKGLQPPVGYIGAIKGVQCKRLPKVGECITTTITPSMTIGNVQVVNGEVRCEDELIASAEFKIFLQEEQ